MNSRRKKFFVNLLKYFLSLAVAGLLFWYVYGDLSFEEMFNRFREVNYYWVLLSIVISLFSHLFRAYRWNILLYPLGYRLKSWRTILAVLVGYFANLLVPRMGEFSRCTILKKTDNVELSTSLGSVVAERAFDMIILLTVTLLSLFIEYDKLMSVLSDVFSSKITTLDNNLGTLTAIGLIGILIIIFAIFWVRNNSEKLRRNALFIKIRSFIRSMLDGIFSVRKIENRVGFWASTLLLWVAYFLMAYVIFFAFEPTSGLGIKAGIMVLIMGGMGMAAPVQGGVGTYHLLVSGILIFYGIKDEDGKFFAFLIHTSQFLTLLVFGGLSFIISLMIPKRESSIYANKEQNMLP